MSKSQLQNNLNNENLSGTTKLISKSILNDRKITQECIENAKAEFGFNNSKEHIKQKLIILKDLLKDCQDQNVKIWLRDKISECIIEMY